MGVAIIDVYFMNVRGHTSNSGNVLSSDAGGNTFIALRSIADLL